MADFLPNNNGPANVITGIYMKPFTKTINGSEFHFQAFLEGADEACRVSVDGQNFKMIVGDAGEWEIRQQVPSWIKQLEKELAEAIDSVYC